MPVAPDPFFLIAEMRRDAKSGKAKSVRLTAGFSLREMAEHLSYDEVVVKVTALRRWEQGINRPPAKVALRWAETLHRLVTEIEAADTINVFDTSVRT